MSNKIEFVFAPKGSHESLTLSASPLQRAVPPDANGVLIQALTQNARVTFDGSDPSASVGFRITAGADFVFLPLASGTLIRMVQETSGAIVQLQPIWWQ